ncbi:MAG: prephenate dehydrogenase/arogenate dehydrogenase family protein [Tissierellia bacterium]|nr:prephenate dehydrogenase/arogenate dehydrogenase family protein [Tissierellia bacterium]
MKNIGFVGLGVMGYPMAINIIKKTGKNVIGFDLVEEKRANFKEKGGISVENPEEVYRNCDVIFLCLPTNELVKSTIESVINTSSNGTIIIDMSSTNPTIIKELYLKAKNKGMHLLDSPVSGGEALAITGELAIMVGGDREIFEKVKELLMSIGKSVTYVGPSGSGDIAKLANNIIVAGYLGAFSEGFAFAVKAGMDPELLYKAIKDGAAGCVMLDQKMPKIYNRDFTPGARIAVHQKDLKNAAELAQKLNVELPITDMVLGYMKDLEADGKADEDQGALIKVYEKKMKVLVKKHN